jgi:hypothetical protein
MTLEEKDVAEKGREREEMNRDAIYVLRASVNIQGQMAKSMTGTKCNSKI